MRRHGAAALLTLALTACTGGGGGGPTPTPQPPATPEYTRTLLDTLSLPAGCDLMRDAGFSSVHRAGFQPDGRGGALLGLRCITNGLDDLRSVYRLNAAGVGVAADAPAGMDGYGVNGAGLYFMGDEQANRTLPYVTAQGERFTAPYLYESDVVNGFYGNSAALTRVDEDGSVHGVHVLTRVSDDSPNSVDGTFLWTWQPGQARRQVESFPAFGPNRVNILDVVPGRPGSGERIVFFANDTGPSGVLLAADGSIVTPPAAPAGTPTGVKVERWTPGGYVVITTSQINGASVHQGYFLWRDGQRVGRTGTLESVAADGDAVVVLGGHVILRRPSGEEFVLPAVDRGNSAYPVRYVAAGGGIVYAVAENRVYRFAPPSLSPSGSVTLSAVTPADQLAADPLPGAGARATRRADGSHLSVKLSAPVAGHQRTLLLTLHGPLSAGQTFTLGGASGAQVTGVTFTDIRTSPAKVNTLFARSGTVTLDGWTGGSAKLTLRNVVLGGNDGQSVTLGGTLTLPEVELE
ncbi:hypothetical protein [Deinococcus sp. PEB2-63]